ncbi:MAG TPA: hypothetical protein PLZ93_06475 [Nocardioides sp.]|uniref:hypothetical protein n=1 Tax=uncultured Nocardioides sp. TaxID=198441 RepID=UPI00260848FA|nr:hypothetical protein [uncultured Nocardioides sp.]HRD61566.1 hypothetical protein [Nocardioides sp.]HRI95237.1 hypothetical protein [Nocardioides sp.]HRK44981.1 hypothetical protein [Nocardioides sp.]
MENLDLKAQLDKSTPLVIGVVLVLGFLLLLIALRAPLIAALGTQVSLMSTAAAFGSHDCSSRRASAPTCSASSPRASSTPGHRCSSSR